MRKLTISVGLLICVLTFDCSFAQEKLNDPVSIQLSEGQKSDAIDLADFKWLAGSWVGGGLGGQCVETWSEPQGDAMVGSFLYSQDGKAVFSEHFSLSKVGDSVTLKLKHFDNNLVGWEEKDKSVEFKFVKRNGNKFHFSGMTYVNVSEDKMDVYVLIKQKDDKVQEEKFEFKRSK